MDYEFIFIKIIMRKFRRLIIKTPLIDRWLIGQLLPPMFFAIGAFTAVSLSVGIMFDLVRKIEINGFKFLYELLSLSKGELVVHEVPLIFKERRYGNSKLDIAIICDLLI